MDKHTSSSSITRQLQVVFAISVIILLISSYASFYSNKKLIDSSDLVNHTNEVIISTESLVSTVKDAETGQRGYIITDDPVFLQPYKGAYERVLKLYQHLRQLTADNPVQQAHLDRLKVLVDQRFSHMQKVLDASSSMSISDRSSLFVTSHDDMLKGKQLMDEVRNVVEQMRNEEKRLLKIRIDEQEAYTKYTPVLVILSALISVIISVIAYFRIKNDLDDRIKKQKEDEARYIETTNRISAMEQVTQKIAAGDYAARSMDVAKDELGRISAALNDMAVSLESNFNEMRRRDWIQSGSVNIGKAIRGEVFVKNLSDKIINSIATYLNAHVGTLYIADKDLNLKLYGTYATSNAPVHIVAGEGLAGQVVVNKEMIITGELPAHYMHISSSIGNTSPAYAIILPLVFADLVIGVIELGMLRQPLEMEVTFLQNNMESLAIGINAALNYEKIQDLLEETQAQSEELQAQHNELENINAELEVQTEKLQASEEELRVQQEELQQANQELEERTRLLEERNIQIIEKNQEVQRKAEELALSTKYKSEFLANMSHELRTPLNSILLLSRLLKENSDNNLTNDQVEYATVIQSSGNGLLTLIDEILDLSKIEAGKMQLEYSYVSVDEIVREIQPLFEPVAKEKGIGFHITLAKNTPQNIETDKLRLGQVLKNLLSNAMKFTSQGSVSLIVDNCPPEPGFICFNVKDTGIGIAADKQKLIFEAFQQEDGSTRRKFGGTGLGLSISREIVKLLGGKIELVSEPGKGSEFIVFIPKDKEMKLQEEAPQDIPEPVKAKHENGINGTGEKYISIHIPENVPDDRTKITEKDKSILIVEDDTNFAKSLLDYTRKKGYKGIVAVRGDEGITLAKEYRPTGILLDIELPVKSGWQVMEELKKDPRTRHIPVHIMSSHQARKESLMKGAVDFINKPMAFEQMQQVFTKLEDVLSRDPKKVLIVEENPKHAKALSYFLETFNVNTDIKNTIADSVTALKNNVDCVILDMGIPDQRGYDMLEEVKNTEGLENLPIIIFTGKSLSIPEEQRIRRYADSIVVKTAHSYQRILDEVSLFLHLMEENKKATTGNGHKKLGALNDVLKDKTVLIVDDDVRNIFSLTKALEKLGMNIVTAVDGKEALVKLGENKNTDIVLLDMMMPEMDGYETAKKIREHFEWRNLPVIAVTAKAMTGDREKCIAAGASDYITKPVDIDQLLSLLRVWLYEKTV